MNNYAFFITICLLFATILQANPNDSERLNQSEWQSIQTQIAKSQYQPQQKVDGSYQAINHQHGFWIHYDQSGKTTLKPYRSSGYYIGMRLREVMAHSMPEKPVSITIENNKLSYHWNNNIEEFWVNSEKQLEQWFMIQNKPARSNPSDDLVLAMKVDTNLQINEKNDVLTFSGDGKNITYDKLKVWDADNKVIPSRMQIQDDLLNLIVQDQKAVYPLTIDPSFTQKAYIKASNTGQGDGFGSRVVISGDTLAVSAVGEDSDATGINGDQENNNVSFAGAVYVFIRENDIWQQQAYIKASNTEQEDYFGRSLALDGDTLVVGVPSEDSDAVGINGDQLNNNALQAGAVYVFIRENDDWKQQAYIKASNTDPGDLFGHAVDISGNTLAVGAYHERSGATGINGNQMSNTTIQSGAVYVFVRENNAWEQQAYIKASNTGATDRFGWSVALDGDTLAVAAYLEDSNATGVNGDQDNNNANQSGAVYVFVRENDIWEQQAYIKASNTDDFDQFGWSIALSDNTLAVGTHVEDSNAQGINNGDQENNDAPNSGVVYVFERDEENNWIQQAYIKASNAESDDEFGWSVALDGDSLAVTAYNEDSNAVGINGNSENNDAQDSGAAYLFIRENNEWKEKIYIKASNAESFDYFGNNIALDCSTLVTSSEFERSGATGVNDDEGQSDNSVQSAGAAYVFDFSGPCNVIFTDGFE